MNTFSSKFSKFSDLKFGFTGSLTKLKRSEAKKIVENNGGTVSSSITNKTNYLVAGENAGSKVEKAKNKSIKVITENEFLKI